MLHLFDRGPSGVSDVSVRCLMKKHLSAAGVLVVPSQIGETSRMVQSVLFMFYVEQH